MGANALTQMLDEQIAADGGAKVLEACQSVVALEKTYPDLAAAIRDEAAGTTITPDAALEHVRGYVATRKDVPAPAPPPPEKQPE